MPISLATFEEVLKKAKSLTELDEAFKTYLNSWNITGYTFSFYAPIKSKKTKLCHEFTSNRLKSWHEYYHQEDFTLVDQTQSETTKSLTPVFWDVHQQLKEAKTKKDRKMRQETLNYGVEKGVSIPIHGIDSDYAELTLRQFKDETCLVNWQEDKFEWQIAALYYCHYLRLFLQTEAAFPIKQLLTLREQQCLELLLKDFAPFEIAKTLRMTERTANFHIQNINHKLGTRNKYQTIAKVKNLKK